jgi:response regulator of citrate/malate metabolism
MIRTLVIDDDYRVAKVHAASVDRIEGFTSVGEAHSAAEAQTLIQAQRPNLLLLDLYLPDGGGLQLIRSLPELDLPVRPDFIVITAARDIDSVRQAIQLGAMYYLVKPFGFVQLREQLEAYRHLHEGLEEATVATQKTVDTLYGLMRNPGTRATERSRLSPTAAEVLEQVRASANGLSAAEVAGILGVSRATAQRHLAQLVRAGLVDLRLNYGSTGRPEHRYRDARST